MTFDSKIERLQSHSFQNNNQQDLNKNEDSPFYHFHYLIMTIKVFHLEKPNLFVKVNEIEREHKVLETKIIYLKDIV